MNPMIRHKPDKKSKLESNLRQLLVKKRLSSFLPQSINTIFIVKGLKSNKNSSHLKLSLGGTEVRFLDN
jgi:hypothetical protein